jgi:GNAT superfamily N-acetyltransferase
LCYNLNIETNNYLKGSILMNDNVEIRLIRFDELGKLLELYDHFEHDDPHLEDSDSLNKLWEEIYNDPALFYIVAVKNGELISTCNITIIKNLTRNARPYGLIENVVTHKEHRNKGYGKQVLKKAIEIAKEKNCYKVMLMTGSKKEETLKFYESAGFLRGVKTGFIVKL